MTEQKFFPGDRVRIRSFDEIDVSDLGNIRHDVNYCFGIGREHINKVASEGTPYYIEHASTYADVFTYSLSRDESGEDIIAYHWAQGMLDRYEEEDLSDVELGDLSWIFGIS